MCMTHRATCLPLYFFLNDTATTESYTLSLHDALPISEEAHRDRQAVEQRGERGTVGVGALGPADELHASAVVLAGWAERGRKSTRLNSSHQIISYAVLFLNKKKAHADSQLHHGRTQHA